MHIYIIYIYTLGWIYIYVKYTQYTQILYTINIHKYYTQYKYICIYERELEEGVNEGTGWTKSLSITAGINRQCLNKITVILVHC